MQKEVVSCLLHVLLLLWLSDAIKDAVKGLTKDPLSVKTSACPFNPETQLKLHLGRKSCGAFFLTPHFMGIDRTGKF